MNTATKSSDGYYTQRTRARAIELYLANHSGAAVDRMLGIPRNSAIRWVRAAGVVRPRPASLQLAATGTVWRTPEAMAALRTMRRDGVPFATIARHISRLTGCAVSAPMLKSVARKHGMTTSKSRALLIKHNSPNTPEGRRRLARIRTIVEMRMTGATYREISAVIGVADKGLTPYTRTPYAEALRACVYGSDTRPEVKVLLARAMYWHQGLPPAFIARTLDTSVACVMRAIEVKPTPVIVEDAP